mgnify:CR=1 FL=1
MAIDFMTALRERARAQERGARLSGRPLTQAETAAPYVAMADTAGDRNARGRALQLQEQAQTTQAGQFGQTLEFNKTTTAENQRLERERLSESSRAEAARMAFQREQMGEQLDAADKALTRDYVQSGLGLAGNAYMVNKLFGGGTAVAGTPGMGAVGAQAGQQFAGWGSAGSQGLLEAPGALGVGAEGVGAGYAGDALGASLASGWEGAGAAGVGAAGTGAGLATAGGVGAEAAAASGYTGAAMAAEGAALGGAASVAGPAAVVALPIMAYAFNQGKARAAKQRMEADPVWQGNVVAQRAQENQSTQEFAQLQTPEQRAAYITRILPQFRSTVIQRANNSGLLTPTELANLMALDESLKTSMYAR